MPGQRMNLHRELDMICSIPERCPIRLQAQHSEEEFNA
jgi:hypothetical protein